MRTFIFKLESVRDILNTNWTVVCSIMETGHRRLYGRAVGCRCPPSSFFLAADGWLSAFGAKGE